MESQSSGEFQGSETVLLATVMLDTWHYALVKAHRTIVQ